MSTEKYRSLPPEQLLDASAIQVAWDPWRAMTPAERMSLVDRGFSPGMIGWLAACRMVERMRDEADPSEAGRKGLLAKQ